MADTMGLALIVEGLSNYENATVTVRKLNSDVANSMMDVEQASGPAQMGVGDLAKAFTIGNLAADAFKKALNFVVGMAKKVVVDSTLLAARVDVLGVVLERVGGNLGMTKTQLAELEEGVKACGITTQAARQSLITMAQANVDLSYATDLARVAQNAAFIAGINSSDAFERLIYAMSRGRTEVMHTLGIMTNFVRAENDLAKSMGRSRKELTEAEIMQARYKETMRAATAIAGVYEAAMGKAGKMMKSLDRFLEELQLEMGKAFQPAFSTVIFEIKDRLEALTATLKDPETQRSLKEFGEALDKVLKLIISIADKAGDVKEIVGLFRDIAVGIASITQDTKTAEQTVGRLWTSLKEFATLWVGLFSAQVAGLKQLGIEVINVADVIIHAARVVKAVWSGQSDLIDEAVKGFGEAVSKIDFSAIGDAAQQAFDDAVISAGRFLGVVEETASGTNKFFNEMQKARSAAFNLRSAMGDLGAVTLEATDEMAEAAEALVKLELQLQREYADALIEQERETLQREIELAREREDMAREHADAVADAYADAEAAKAKLAEEAGEEWAEFEEEAAKEREEIDLDYARTREDIERDLVRTLEDIQEQFEQDVQDAARTRDAFALVQAQRRAAQETEEAKENRDEQLEDARIAYEQQIADYEAALAEQRADLEESLAEQQQAIELQLQQALAAAEAEYQQELAALDLRLQREQEMQALQAQWEEEDRRLRLARQLEDMEAQYGNLYGITAEGLLQQVAEWAEAYGPEGAASQIIVNFKTLVTEQFEAIQQAMVDLVDQWQETMKTLSQDQSVSLPEELQFQSPKLGLQVGLESLQKYMKAHPLGVMVGGQLPATGGVTSSRAESYSRTETRHDVNVNMPNMDAVVARQMVNMFRQVLAA